MGVHGLWRLLESTGKPINPETLEGKILAVDISIWLNQAVKGVRDRDGNSVHNAHLLTLFHRICKLLFFRIRPIFVFDGDAPLLKRQTLAVRRQRKDELSRESKETSEKLLKTFLKRQAIKAALGDHSKDPLPSLSTVRRDEVDDMYVLPALPVSEEVEKSSSEEEEEEEELEETNDGYQMYPGDVHGDPNSVDINSEEFTGLPPEMKQEILKDMKEFSKRRRTMYHKPPERSGEFSNYQLAGLLQRNHLNQRLRGVEKEMSQQSAGSAPQLGQHDGDVESQRLVSEDYSHYILVKGSKKREAAPESRPAAAAWSGSCLVGGSRRAPDRPEPLWRPPSEAEAGAPAPSSEESKASVSQPARGGASPPSPRTLEAIRAAMSDSSEEETAGREKKDGSVSPRTRQAIQRALAEEEDSEHRTPTFGSPAKVLADIPRAVPPVVVSSSEEEGGPDGGKPLPRENSDLNLAAQSLHVEDGLFAGRSEDETEATIVPRNEATAQKPHDGEMKPEKKNQSAEDVSLGGTGRTEKEQALIAETTCAAAFSRNTLPTNLSAQPCGEPLSAEAQKSESESEESFLEVSDEELGAEGSLVMAGKKGSPGEVRKDEIMQEGKPEEGLEKAPGGPAADSEEEEEEEEGEDDKDKERQTGLKEGTETESTSTHAMNEWEHFDVEELEALESSLQVEQSNLRELKQQQERMANTVTGQMHLESQELLRLFGVPFMVAPMEAEAQCAALDRADHTNGTITDDSDVWLFGGRHVYRNFFSQDKYVEHYQYSDLQNQLGLDRTKLINLAYLLGSDYTEGVPGVGYVTGMEILNEFPGSGLEPLTQFSEWWSEVQEKKRLVADPRDTKVKKKLRDLKLYPGFPNPAVAQAYLQPAVDQSDNFFSWGRPQPDMIKEFCLNRFGWSSRRTEETLMPVIKQLSSQQFNSVDLTSP
ncbi:DNA excision repair protein ERCC-5 isoform 2-T2 [Spinachia spinachia]